MALASRRLGAVIALPLTRRLTTAATAPGTRATTADADVSDIKQLGVLGAGQMGLGIALVAAKQLAVPVWLVDSSAAALAKSMALAGSLLARDVAKGRLTAAAAAAVSARLQPSTDDGVLREVDFVIEAVPEDAALKAVVFARLAQICGAHAVLATNTSSISVTQLAAATGSAAAAARVVATHFMNPVPVQTGVEIVAGLQTAPATVARAERLCRALGKTPARSADVPGFLANRILMPYLNEAVLCLESGVGSRDDIDALMRNGTGVPMGPLALADFIGLDTCLAVMRVIHADTGDSKYRPAVLLCRMVDAGWLGRKSGRGFYHYADRST